MMNLSRRGFVAASAATLLSASIPRLAFAKEARPLRAETRVLDIEGRAVTVFGLNGGKGVVLDPGERFQVALTNTLDVETLIHWHGQIPPNEQDGVPTCRCPCCARVKRGTMTLPRSRARIGCTPIFHFRR
jgi:FtsP/CotA-like multicopper oxidase with cupredoxin domain